MPKNGTILGPRCGCSKSELKTLIFDQLIKETVESNKLPIQS